MATKMTKYLRIRLIRLR